MKKLSERSLQIRSVLKTHFKEKKISYSDLAKELKVSTPTIKRWMTKDDFPFEALDKILKMIDWSWVDLDQMLDLQVVKRVKLKDVHESYISQRPRHAYVYLLVHLGYRFPQMIKHLKIDEKTLESYLIDLDRANFVAYTNKENFRSLVKLPIQKGKESDFSKRFFLPVVKLMLDEVVQPFKYFTHIFSPSQPLVRVGEFFLSPASLVRFKAELFELVERYEQKGRQERVSKGIDQLVPAGYLLALEEISLWKKVMWDSGIK